MPEATPVLDWWHIAMRFEHALQAARGLGANTPAGHLRGYAVRDLEGAKWLLWHGRSSSCLERLTKLAGWFGAPHVRNTLGALTSEKYIRELVQYLRANRCALVNYGRRRHARLPISTAFVESAVNEKAGWGLASPSAGRSWRRTAADWKPPTCRSAPAHNFVLRYLHHRRMGRAIFLTRDSGSGL